MRWNFNRSMEIKKAISTNPDLMQELSKTVQTLLKEHKIDLSDKSYVFEPRVFNYTQKELPDIKVKAQESLFQSLLAKGISGGIIIEGEVASIADKWDSYVFLHLPEHGGMNPMLLERLGFFRIHDKIYDDPIPVMDSYGLIKRMVGSKELMVQFSEKVFGLMERHNIKLKEDEGCVFTPIVFDTPIYAQKVGTARQTSKLLGFGPQILADSNPLPAHPSLNVLKAIQPFPGIIDGIWGPTAGVIVDRWWWVGIPAPELLVALDKIRNFSY